jgi:hypothetical protein
MKTSTVAASLGLLFLSWFLYQRLIASDKDDFQTVSRSKDAANPIAEAIARGYHAVSHNKLAIHTAD